MKICAIIAEYNPLHNGHIKLIEFAKANSGCDKLLVIMSGNFTQRGENAVMDKFTRATHAVKAGADIVVELPTVFATANAEIFSSGAVKILTDLNCIDTLAFGVESGTLEDYEKTAKAMLTESKALKQLIKEELETGVSHAKARFNAVKKAGIEGINEDIIATPNNILALEYMKAKIKYDSKIKFLPFKREGNHNSTALLKNVTSATSIREQLKVKKIGKLKGVMPSYVFDDLPKTPYDFSQILMSALYRTDAETLSNVLDCTEGLENRIKALIKDNFDYEVALEKITTKRYTYARVKRIVVANLLRINKKQVIKALDSELYCKVLAVNKDAKDVVSYICNHSNIPVLTRKKDYTEVKKFANEILLIDELACELYSLVTGIKQNEYQMLLV